MILLSVILYVTALGAPALGIPVYGSTRFGRASTAIAPPPAPFFYRPARFYPYSDNYNDLYYRPMPVMHYQYYRPEDIYRNVHPYYFSPYYNENDEAYESIDDSENAHIGSNSRTEALPIGQETWFEGDSNQWRNDYDDMNAAFLQGLIFTQLVDDATRSSSESDEDQVKGSQNNLDSYEHGNHEYFGERDTRDFEDEDVRELKALAGKPFYHVPKTSLNYPVNHNSDSSRRSQLWRQDYSTPKPAVTEEDQIDDYQNDEGWINWGSKRNSKPLNQEPAKKVTTKKPTIKSTTTARPALNGKIPATVVTLGGQKEEVLLRPASPARQPFAEPVMHMLESNNLNQNKRAPSVYDTIKQLLTMEESYKPNIVTKGRLQKRYISTEEDLVGELKGLKLKRRSTA